MFGIVIDKNGYKVEFVSLKNGTIQYYELKDGEKVITKDWNIANAMVKPRWDPLKEIWVETGEPKKIDICPAKTTEQKVEELMQEYNDLKQRMKANEDALLGILLG